MKAALEAPRLERRRASWIAFERRERSFAWNWHYHPELELTWIVKGRGRRLVGDHAQRYGEDDLVLLGANLPHCWHSAGEARGGWHMAQVVQFRAGMFPAALLRLPEFAGMAQLLSRAGRGLRFAEETAREVAGELAALKHDAEAAGWRRLAKILDYLAVQSPAEVLATPHYQHERSRRLQTRIERALAYIEKNCGDGVTLSQAARHAHLHPSAFSRFFRKMTHQTFVAYRNGCRVSEACRLLIETERPITDIAFACGFGNLANFNRRFLKEKQMTPGAYRRLHNRPA